MSRSSIYTWEMVQTIIENPEILGHLCGKTLLTPIHGEWMRWYHLATEDSLLQASRGSYKSTALVEVGAIYRLMRNRNATMAQQALKEQQALKVQQVLKELKVPKVSKVQQVLKVQQALKEQR